MITTWLVLKEDIYREKKKKEEKKITIVSLTHKNHE